MSNAYKVTDIGEIVIETYAQNSTSTSRLSPSREIIVKIIDTGPGMPDSILKKWGQPFNYLNNTSELEKKGTGLGQFIIATVKESLKINIPCPEKNPQGRGTVIKIIIPCE